MRIGPFWVGLYSTYEAEVARATSEAEQKATQPLELIVKNLKEQLTDANKALNQNNEELTAMLTRLTRASDTGQFLRDEVNKTEERYKTLEQKYAESQITWKNQTKAVIYYLSLDDTTKQAIKSRDEQHNADWDKFLASLPGKYTVQTILTTPDWEIELPPLRQIKAAIKYEQDNNLDLGTVAKMIADDK